MRTSSTTYSIPYLRIVQNEFIDYKRNYSAGFASDDREVAAAGTILSITSSILGSTFATYDRVARFTLPGALFFRFDGHCGCDGGGRCTVMNFVG